MSEQITKKDLEQVLDKKFEQYQGSVIEAVDFKFQGIEQHMGEIDKRIAVFEKMTEMKFLELEKRMDIFDKKLDRLANILEDFPRRLTDHEDDFKILKAEVDQMKSVFKEKFGVEISMYN